MIWEEVSEEALEAVNKDQDPPFSWLNQENNMLSVRKDCKLLTINKKIVYLMAKYILNMKREENKNYSHSTWKSMLGTTDQSCQFNQSYCGQVYIQSDFT